ncbi:hypothetical protein L9F63_011997 [Diploptera punctata]|uniref:Nudix hydrolase domain-containing protein n=1 Tax=Diploptera punctata TaxID=6984 RepID=A0AAD8EPC0_DIPPU|nr:hypothetical protein L9F63_011997 [Diploptera punctata]
MSKHWKEAASVIIVAKNIFSRNGNTICKKNIPLKNSVNQNSEVGERYVDTCNYNVLMLKRSSTSSFMPDTCVFPGGNTDSADSSKEWLDLFMQNGIQESAFNNFTSKKSNVIDTFESNKESELLKSVSLRITGIRETFEESGILLCKSKHAHPKSNNSKWGCFISGHEVQTWQKKVQQNANDFISLCKHFECYPDIWSLKEWSNWLSPNYFPKRFNTMFFLVNLDQMPPTTCDTDEVNEFKWSSPHEIVDSCNKQELILPPPQYYELSRLITFNDIEKLADFAVQKNSSSSDLWMPFRIKTSDGEVTLFPGDDLYPATPNYASGPTQKVKKTLKELREESNLLHRMEHTKTCSARLIIKNISFSENQIIPQVTSSHRCKI